VLLGGAIVVCLESSGPTGVLADSGSSSTRPGLAAGAAGAPAAGVESQMPEWKRKLLAAKRAEATTGPLKTTPSGPIAKVNVPHWVKDPAPVPSPAAPSTAPQAQASSHATAGVSVSPPWARSAAPVGGAGRQQQQQHHQSTSRGTPQLSPSSDVVAVSSTLPRAAHAAAGASSGRGGDAEPSSWSPLDRKNASRYAEAPFVLVSLEVCRHHHHRAPQSSGTQRSWRCSSASLKPRSA
jgi:hypothetical protein